MISAGNVDYLWHEHEGKMLTGNGKTILETRGASCSETSEQPNVSILREKTAGIQSVQLSQVLSSYP